MPPSVVVGEALGRGTKRGYPRKRAFDGEVAPSQVTVRSAAKQSEIAQIIGRAGPQRGSEAVRACVIGHSMRRGWLPFKTIPFVYC